MRYNRVEGAQTLTKPQPNINMKIHYATMALLAGASVVLSSCVAPTAGYVSYSSTGEISTGVAWTNASYDTEGFPIFGYSYGRPVYGYTSAGAAIFTIAALTALCYVPHWGPATWYHGHYHYPSGIHRVAAPPRYPAGHAPHLRPAAGAHKGPGMPAGAHAPRPGAVKPGAAAHPGIHRPGAVGSHGRNVPPSASKHPHGAPVMRPNAGNGAHNGGVRTLPTHHKVGQAPSMHQPKNGNGGISTLPSRPGGAPVAKVPGSSGNHGGVSTLPTRPSGNPIATVPGSGGSRAGMPSRPAPRSGGNFGGGRSGGRSGGGRGFGRH